MAFLAQQTLAGCEENMRKSFKSLGGGELVSN